jgi:hypothetical protein
MKIIDIQVTNTRSRLSFGFARAATRGQRTVDRRDFMMAKKYQMRQGFMDIGNA